ncbi:MAG TPA: hypothetical protein DEF05_14000 [Erwinia sp.]|uniref:hypothetical protein n=1 Tax=Erwinia citreus TaxID=558 RepID=UPI000E827A29|nr:hypothetical protein [Erwinia sp.]HBV40758.1 hypothetical protein [Erwinia sp.]
MNTNQTGQIAQGQFSAVTLIAEKSGKNGFCDEKIVNYHAATRFFAGQIISPGKVDYDVRQP